MPDVWRHQKTTVLRPGHHVVQKRVVAVTASAVSVIAYTVGPRGGVSGFSHVQLTTEEWKVVCRAVAQAQRRT